MQNDNHFEQADKEAKKQAEYNRIPVVSYAELRAVIDKWLLLKDPAVVDMIIATILSNRTNSDPVWLFLIAASGGGKTELMNALLKVPEYYSLSQLTPNTFLSGYKSKEKEPSLLLQLGSGKTIGFKDFTSILDGNKDAFKEIMGQFRDLFDGYMTKRTGTGDEIVWKGKMGFIAGCVPVLEQKMSMMGAMGERFLSYRMDQADRKEIKTRMKKNIGKESQMREEMQNAMAGYMKGVKMPDEFPPLPEEVDQLVDSLADFIAISRTVVMRGYDSKREIEYINPPEMSTRIYKQLYILAATFLVMNDGVWESRHTYALKNVAMSSIHSLRHGLIKEVQQYTTKVKTSTLATAIGYPTTTTRRCLEDLTAISMNNGQIRILRRTHQGVGKPDLWEITNEMREILKDMSDYVEPYKQDTDFDEDEKDIPVETLKEVGSEQDQVEGQRKLDDLTGGMSEDEKMQLGL